MDDNLNSKLMLGAMIDLRKGVDYTIDEKKTIETHADCLIHINNWLKMKKYDINKFRTWIIDGAMEGLAAKLRRDYNWASRVIVCFGHAYNRIYVNSFYVSKMFDNNNKNIRFVKNYIDGSNINTMQFEDCKNALGITTYAFDSNDPIRFVSNYDAGIRIIDNFPPLLKYVQHLIKQKEYLAFCKKYQEWKVKHQKWKQSQPQQAASTSTLTKQQQTAKMRSFQS